MNAPAAASAPASVVETVAPAAPVTTTTLAVPAHPDGDYLIIGTDAYAVSGEFCDVLGAGAGAPGSVDGEIHEVDAIADGLGRFFFEIDDRGFADNRPRNGLVSASSDTGNGTVYFTADELVIDAPVMGPSVQLSGYGALDPTNTIDAYRAALDTAIGADRMSQISSGDPPTDSESATILQIHGQYYTTPFWLSATCPA